MILFLFLESFAKIKSFEKIVWCTEEITMIKENIFQKNSAYFSCLNEMRNLLRYLKKNNDQLSKLDSSLHA